MIGTERVIAVIPARGGSKSIPRKNLALLGGRPLLAWPIETARETHEIDRVIVSTEDASIARVALERGAEVYPRPLALATDDALVIDAIRHLRGVLAAEGESARILVLLEPTSPLRSPALIARCLERLAGEDLDSIATFHESPTPPERFWRIEGGRPRPFLEGAVPWRPRQALTKAYQLNGAVYAFRVDRLPPECPGVLFGRMGAEVVTDRVVDIDTELDLRLADVLLRS